MTKQELEVKVKELEKTIERMQSNLDQKDKLLSEKRKEVKENFNHEKKINELTSDKQTLITVVQQLSALSKRYSLSLENTVKALQGIEGLTSELYASLPDINNYINKADNLVAHLTGKVK